MNLWAKGKGLLTLIIMFAALCTSCEDEENTIGLPVENQLNLNYVEFQVPVEMVWTDSVISQNTGFIYAGRFDLGEAGMLSATPYVAFSAQAYDSAINIPAGAVLKDFYLELDYAGALMSEDVSTETFQVYQLEDTINNFVLHFTEDKQGYNQLIGEKTFEFNPDSVKLDQERDSIDYREKIPLDLTLGEDFFNKLKQQDSTTFYNREAFETAFPGITIVPGTENSVIPAFSPEQSRIIITYEYEDSGNTKTGSFTFRPSAKFYHNITPNKEEMIFNGGTFSDITCCNIGYNPVGDFVYQVFGTGINLKLDLSAFKMFTDTLDNKIILNTAVLELDDVAGTVEGTNPPSSIAFYLTDETGQRSSGERSNIDIYRTLTEEQVNADPLRLGEPAIVNYNPVQEAYKVTITLFLEHMIENPSLTPGHLIMEAADFSTFGNLRQLRRSSRTLGAVKIPKESIKIKMYYSTME